MSTNRSNERPSEPGDHVDPVRLIEAADCLLEAQSKRPNGLALVDVWMGKAGGTPAKGLYTYSELVEAMAFLIRLGVVEPKGQETIAPAGKPKGRP
jgi:hypothetical protein